MHCRRLEELLKSLLAAVDSDRFVCYGVVGWDRGSQGLGGGDSVGVVPVLGGGVVHLSYRPICLVEGRCHCQDQHQLP